MKALAGSARAIPRLSVATFNVLAPCYKRMPHKVDVKAQVPARGRAARRRVPREMEFPELWKVRQKECISLIRACGASVVGLQEYWFNETSQAMYKAKDGVGDLYKVFELQRPYKADGVAILGDEKSCKVLDEVPIVYGYHGHRVALLLRLEFLGCGATTPARQLVVANTHLTFPHSESDNRLRLKQCRRLLTQVDEYISKHALEDKADVFIMGDMNETAEGPVYNEFVNANFVSSFGKANNAEAKVTHLSHRRESVGVDYIWYRGAAAEKKTHPPICCVAAELLPTKFGDQAWPTAFVASDHRPLVSEFAFGVSENDGVGRGAGAARPRSAGSL